MHLFHTGNDSLSLSLSKNQKHNHRLSPVRPQPAGPFAAALARGCENTGSVLILSRPLIKEGAAPRAAQRLRGGGAVGAAGLAQEALRAQQRLMYMTFCVVFWRRHNAKVHNLAKQMTFL